VRELENLVRRMMVLGDPHYVLSELTRARTGGGRRAQTDGRCRKRRSRPRAGQPAADHRHGRPRRRPPATTSTTIAST